MIEVVTVIDRFFFLFSSLLLLCFWSIDRHLSRKKCPFSPSIAGGCMLLDTHQMSERTFPFSFFFACWEADDGDCQSTYPSSLSISCSSLRGRVSVYNIRRTSRHRRVLLFLLRCNDRSPPISLSSSLTSIVSSTSIPSHLLLSSLYREVFSLWLSFSLSFFFIGGHRSFSVLPLLPSSDLHTPTFRMWERANPLDPPRLLSLVTLFLFSPFYEWRKRKRRRL